jgi:hypothetical protein
MEDDGAPTTADVQEIHEVAGQWQAVIEEMEALAAEYEASGYETLTCRPGDVSAVVDEERSAFGLYLLAPDDTFEMLSDRIDADTVDRFEVYRRSDGPYHFLVVALFDEDDSFVFLYPAYYTDESGEELVRASRERGRMRTTVRTLSGEKLRFTHDWRAFFGRRDDRE